jgi:hypothetical protein
LTHQVNDYANALNDLGSLPGNRLEVLRGDLKGFHSVRVNDQWRVIFNARCPRRSRRGRLSLRTFLMDRARMTRTPTTAVTAEVALKLGATFSTTPEFWLNAQKAVDLFAARAKLRRLPKPLIPGRRPAA